MSRKHKHEEHANHEAWAIPYGDLVTLLLAFFVVMYSISSVNEGKFRVLSDAMSEAFGGPPRSLEPVQVGRISRALPSDLAPPINLTLPNQPNPKNPLFESEESRQRSERNLDEINARIVEAMADLIKLDMVEIKRSPLMLEVELKSDIFFASGSAVPNTRAVEAARRLAASLQPFPNPIRIEGHTDNIPIQTLQFPSNWELSAARAASVVHVFMDNGIAADRMTVVGYSDQAPKEDNGTEAGRAANRRVVLVIPASEDLQPEGGDAAVLMEDPAVDKEE